MLPPGRRTVATTSCPGEIAPGTAGPASTTTPRLSCPGISTSSPGGASPYSPEWSSLSVPSTPTLTTCTRTPRPSSTSATDGVGCSIRWRVRGWRGRMARAFIAPALEYDESGGRLRPRATGELDELARDSALRFRCMLTLRPRMAPTYPGQAPTTALGGLTRPERTGAPAGEAPFGSTATAYALLLVVNDKSPICGGGQ